ncbi:MAG: signal peptide peptidase SppA, partial [Candidatus Zixiibacteriota bacterium]
TKLLDAEYVYHFEVIPIPGLYLNGYLDSDKNFQLGVRTNLLQYFAGSKSLSDKKGNHLGTTTFFGTTDLRQPSIIKEKPRRLALAVSGHPHENPSRPLLGKRKTSFISILLKIYRAAEDPSISEMVLSLDRLSFGMGQAQEFREALTYFKNNGKKITCHLSYPNNISYYIGSVCSEILIPPVSQLNLVGLRAELTFYTGTMEKLGIDFELLRIGKYKTAPESFTRKAATEENKKQINRQLDDLYRQFVTGIAEGRSITEDSVRKIIDNGPFTSKEALEYGLVDGLSYRDEVDNNFLTKMPEISFQRYLTDTLMNDDWQVKPSIAVIVAKGDVTSDRTSSSLLGSDSDVTPSKMKKAFRRALQDKDVKGIVLRIDSPGGMALIGDEIYHLAQKAAEKKPVVVSMANIAASGGYYIAMSGRHIYANPATITGSIGIYGGKVNLSQLYQKINLGKELYTRGKFAGMFTSIRPFSDEEHEKYFSQLKAMYGHFISLVAENRNLTVDSVDNLAQGRVWTGKEAQVNGLIDELGGLKPSVDFAAGRLMLDDYQIKI